MNVRWSILITSGARFLEMSFAFTSSVLLARLLSLEDFGIYSIAASIVLIGYLLRNFGVGQLIIQADHLDDQLLRAAFSITLMLSWSMALALFVAAPWVGDFYGHEGVTEVLRFLVLNFILVPFGAVSHAILHRRMLFDRLAIIGVSSAGASLVVGVSSALMGAEYLSLAWGANASTVTTVALTLLFRPPGLPWRPGLAGMRRIFSFGARVGLMDIVNKSADSSSEMLIGKAHGLHDLGLYSRAYGAFLLFEHFFITGIRPVVLPYLSEARRAREDLGAIYLRIVSHAAVFMVPFFAFLGLSSEDVILFLYGDQWGAASPVLNVMAMAGVLLSVTVYFDQLLIAHGNPGLALRYQVISQVVRMVVLVLLLGTHLEWVAVALVAGSLVRALMVFRLSKRLFAVTVGTFLEALRPAVVIGAGIVLSLWLTQPLLADSARVVRLGVTGAVSALLWLGLVLWLGHPLGREIRALAARLARRG